MLDFLPKILRTKIVNHPQLKFFFTDHRDGKLFTQNLETFAPGLGLSAEDVTRINKSVEGIATKEFKEITSSIYNKAGFDVYIHGGNRNDLNDTRLKDLDGNICESYTRAMHRLHGLWFDGFWVQSIGKHSYENQSMVYGKAIPIVTKRLTIISPPNSERRRFVRDDWGRDFNWGSDMKGFSQLRDFLMYPVRDQRPKDNHPNYIILWKLGENIIVKQKQFVRQIEPKKVKVRREGLMGKIGFHKTVEQTSETFYIPDVSGREISLNEIVRTQDNSSAYVMEFFFFKEIVDGLSSHRPSYAKLVFVIASRDIVERSTSFLLRYPDLFMEFIRGFVPASKFPKVQVILDTDIPTKGLVVRDFINGEEIIV